MGYRRARARISLICALSVQVGMLGGNVTVWLFYAGPENWLDDNGERDFSEQILWSCERYTQHGDLALLYRKSIDHMSPARLVKEFNLKREVAEEVKRRELGKDISLVWKVTSVKKLILPMWWRWAAGCWVERITRIDPPLKLDELRKDKRLWGNWEDLRRNFHASGRAALEIPLSAWTRLAEMIEERSGVKL